MGYHTSYDLTVKNNDKDESIQWAAAINEFLGYPLFSENTPYASDTTWNNEEKDMRKFSQLHPDILFEIEWDGDNSEDKGTTYYKNGKMQECEAIITYPPFDESKLQ